MICFIFHIRLKYHYKKYKMILFSPFKHETIESIQVKNAMTNDDFILMISQKYYNYLFRYISRVCHNKSMVLDIVQETFMIASEKADELQSHENIHAWLYCTAKYKMLQFLAESLNYEELDSIADSVPDIRDFENECIASLEEQKYPRIAQTLSEEDLQLVIKHYEYGYGIRELAEDYHTTESSIKMRLHRIKKKLRKSYPF